LLALLLLLLRCCWNSPVCEPSSKEFFVGGTGCPECDDWLVD
jgi:hypothetical protein